jgi:hypothetical protein
MEPIKEHIKQSLVNYVANAHADGYGQLKTMDVYRVFGDRTKEALEYLKEDQIVRVSTYGDRYGSYHGIGGIRDIQDELTRALCEDAWKNNKSRTRNLNQW